MLDPQCALFTICNGLSLSEINNDDRMITTLARQNSPTHFLIVACPLARYLASAKSMSVLDQPQLDNGENSYLWFLLTGLIPSFVCLQKAIGRRIFLLLCAYCFMIFDGRKDKIKLFNETCSIMGRLTIAPSWFSSQKRRRVTQRPLSLCCHHLCRKQKLRSNFHLYVTIRFQRQH